VVVARDADVHGKLRVELGEVLGGRRLEELELQPAAEARLVDVDEERVHLALVGQLLQERAKGLLDLGALLLVRLQVHGELLLLEERFLLLGHVLLAFLDLVLLVRPEQEEERDLDDDEDDDEGADLGKPRPVAGLLRVECL
jgi:hypothetical protein